VPLGFVRATPAAVRTRLCICMIIWFTINVFIATEEIGTERGQGLRARPLHHDARPVLGRLPSPSGRPPSSSGGPLSSSVFLDAKLIRKIYVWPENIILKRLGFNSRWEGRNGLRLFLLILFWALKII